MVKEHKSWSPPSFRINLNIYTLSYFYRPLRVLSLSRTFLEFSLKFVHPTMIWEKFSNLWCSHYWKMHLRIRKVNLGMSHVSHRENSPPGSYHHLSGRGKSPIPQQAGFFRKSIHPSRKREKEDIIGSTFHK